MISDDALKKFKDIWREEFNEEISDDEAVRLGTDLLTAFDNVYRPIKKDWIQIKINTENTDEHENTTIPNQ